jgi:hypothetical protein
MRWFGKNERKEIWDEAIQWPIGDIADHPALRAAPPGLTTTGPTPA